MIVLLLLFMNILN